MAHLKDLIVSGVTRFIGKVYGTITNAIKDDKDQTISSTYIKNITGGGLNSLTITKGDGTSSDVTMSMEPHVVNLGAQETSTRSCVTSLGQGITIYTCTKWTDKPAGAPDTQGTLITVAYNNSSQEMGTEWVWAHQYFMSPFVTYPWVRMGSATILTEWARINDGGNADTVDGLHADDFFRKGSQVQFVPYNMKYYALNDKICLFSNDDDVARGIYFVNNSSSNITVCVLVSATAEGPVCQYGYGTNTYPEIQDTGENREWFTIESIPTSPVIYAMDVPPGKLGYFGFYGNSASTYTTVHDIRCPYFNFF